MCMVPLFFQIAVINYDRVDNKVNAINLEVGAELTTLHDALQADAGVKAMVIFSDKPNDFIAGADINIFDECKVRSSTHHSARLLP